MADLVGMNAWEIRQLARSMTLVAGELARVASAASQEISAAKWAGPDRDRFLDTWNSEHAAALVRAADGLQSAARDAGRSAEAQERASRAH